MIDPRTFTPRAAAAAAIAVTALGAGAATAVAAPHLSKQQVHALTQSCRYFSSDYTALVGIQKMANLTGPELRSALRYVAADIDGARPPLPAAKRAELSQAAKILTQMAASTPARSATTAEKTRLTKRFRSAPFLTLNATVETACRYLRSGKTG